jgi:hypothetical protein
MFITSISASLFVSLTTEIAQGASLNKSLLALLNPASLDQAMG